MWIEALTPLRIKLPDRDLCLTAGQLRDLSDDLATRLVQHASGKVRVVDPSVVENLQPGAWVSWESPLFGRCTGQIALAPENSWLVVRCHSVTGDLSLVKVDGIRPEVKGEPSLPHGSQSND